MRSKQDNIRFAAERKRLKRLFEGNSTLRFIGPTPKHIEKYMRRLPKPEREEEQYGHGV